jgi:hypothetical protein
MSNIYEDECTLSPLYILYGVDGGLGGIDGHTNIPEQPKERMRIYYLKTLCSQTKENEFKLVTMSADRWR